jgi:ABC-type multidrug transport system fused ATPase/permease subunit
MKLFSNISFFFRVIEKKRQRYFFIIIFALLFQSLLEATSVGIVIPLLSSFLNPEYTTGILKNYFIFLKGYSQSGIIIILLVSIFFFFLFKALILYLITKYNFKFIYNIQIFLKDKIFSNYLSIDYGKLLLIKSNKLISNLSVNLAMFTNYFTTPLMFCITDLLIIFSVLIVLIIFYPKLFFIVFVFILITVFSFMKLFHKYIKSLGSKKEEYEQLQVKVINEAVGSIKISRIFGIQNLLKKDFFKFNSSASVAHGNLSAIQQLPRIAIEVLAFGVLSSLIIFLILTGESFANIIPALGLFSAAAFRIMPSVNRLIFSLQGLSFSSSIIESIKNDINHVSPDSSVIAEDNKKLILIEKELSLENVCFKYQDDSANIINNLNFTIKIGESVGIFGQSGVGKTTFLDLLVGLQKPTSGKIIIDKQIVNYHDSKWFSNFGYVTQNNYMFDDTLLRNITLNKKIDSDSVHKILELLQLTKLVENHKDKLNMLIGERGVRLSGGQAQRVGIARAIYHNPRILIMDEPTSSLDIETESYIIKNIRKICRATLVIVSHRETAFADCSLVFKLNDKGNFIKV